MGHSFKVTTAATGARTGHGEKPRNVDQKPADTPPDFYQQEACDMGGGIASQMQMSWRESATPKALRL